VHEHHLTALLSDVAINLLRHPAMRVLIATRAAWGVIERYINTDNVSTKQWCNPLCSNFSKCEFAAIHVALNCTAYMLFLTC